MTEDDYAAAIQRGEIVTRHMIYDGLADEGVLQTDPLWEVDMTTSCWFKRTPEYFEARRRAEQQLDEQKKAAQVALNAKLAVVSRHLPPQKDGPKGCEAISGERYVVIGSVPEGHLSFNCSYQQAIDAWEVNILTYAATASGDVLWWRERPQIECGVPFGTTEGVWYVYSRLLIGNENGHLSLERARAYARELS